MEQSSVCPAQPANVALPRESHSDTNLCLDCSISSLQHFCQSTAATPGTPALACCHAPSPAVVQLEALPCIFSWPLGGPPRSDVGAGTVLHNVLPSVCQQAGDGAA